MACDLVKLLGDLVAIPSVNPMGRDVTGPEYLEAGVTAYLENFFREIGLPTWRQTVAPQRDNLLARLDGDPDVSHGGQLILFDAHQDTVPVGGMTIPPWTPTVRDGRLYGRGSCDVKGGMVAMLGAIARLATERPAGRPTIVMSCTVNEEHGFTGATSLRKLWSEPSPIFPRRPDAAIIAEPTELHVVVAHKGVVRWRLHVRGRAGHSSQPHLADNAIFKMARVLLALETYQKEVVGSLGNHPLCGSSTLSVGTINGGVSVNTVPDSCAIEIDRRLVPGEKHDEIFKHVQQYLAERVPDVAVEMEPPYLRSPGLPDTENGALADALAQAAARAGISSQEVGVPYGTNAGGIAADVPCVIFGPGSIDQAHTVDEWLDLEQLEKASEVLHEFGKHGMG